MKGPDNNWIFTEVFYVGLALAFVAYFAIARAEWLSLSIYLTDTIPQGRCFKREDITIGESRYKKSMDVIVSVEGLYLRPIFPLRFFRPPLLIPWTAFLSWRSQKTYWWDVLIFNLRTSELQSMEMRIESRELSEVVVQKIEVSRLC